MYLDAITHWLIDYAGPQSAARRLDEIRGHNRQPLVTCRTRAAAGTRSPPGGLRAIPAGRKAVIAFTVDDDAREVHVHAVTCCRSRLDHCAAKRAGGSRMARKPVHKWAFKPVHARKRFRMARLRQGDPAVEIGERGNPCRKSRGILSRRRTAWSHWARGSGPRFEHIDTSTGALGTGGAPHT